MRSRILGKWLIVALCAGSAAAAAEPATVIYVDAAASGTGNGSSWANAYNNLQDALAAAASADKPMEIRVAQGVYKPDRGAGITPGDTAATFQLLNGVRLKGGYAGLTQPDPDAWDPSLYETVLSGDLQDDDDLADTKTLRDNSNHVVTTDGADATAVLEAVRITHGACRTSVPGRADSSGLAGGAAIHNRAGRPTVRRCVLSDNSFVRGLGGGPGAAMLNMEGAAARLEQCTFQDNYSVGLYDDGSATVVTDCHFVSNYGGAGSQHCSRPTFEHCTFTDNAGFAVSIRDCNQVTVWDCVFTGNGGAIFSIDCDRVECERCTFTGNVVEPEFLGVVSVQSATFNWCRFSDNVGKDKYGLVAGAIFAADDLRLHSCEFIHNSGASGAVTCGEAHMVACLFAGNCGDVAGAVHAFSDASLVNCTLVGNRSKPQSTPVYDIRGNLVVKNCIIRDNSGGGIFFPRSVMDQAMVGYSCVDVLPEWVWQVECIDADPCFVNPGYWDPNATPDDPNDDLWVNGDYHLKSQAGHWDPTSQTWVSDDVTSPCIDAGDPFFPAVAEREPNGGRINMGIYGNTAEASKSYSESP